MNQSNAGSIVAFTIIAILTLLGLNEVGSLEGAKQDVLAFLEIFK